ncbi:MAG: F0F1 ATP synthase subunit A [Saprospiraceae bacterium]|nr:F0F1 ATP synthase subunit A [Saprospiraceae bacterium]
MMQRIFLTLIYLFFAILPTFSQHEEGHSTHANATVHENEEQMHSSDHKAEQKFDPAGTAVHHISDANVYTILEKTFPLPTILYSKDKGVEMFSSAKFHPGHHEDGHQSYNGYVLHLGSVYRVNDTSFPQVGSAELPDHAFVTKQENIDGKMRDVHYVQFEGKEFKLDPRSTLDGGILGGGMTSFMDFSPTKNVVGMILVSLFLLWMFLKIAKRYKNNPEKAPKGMQGLIEPIFLFIRDEVAIPFIGKEKYMKYLPLLMSIFFFILGLNLFGQIPFLGSVNVTGSLSVTLVIAVLVFIIVNLSGNRHYWSHIFWMPGVPVFVKPLLAGVEVMGLFIKPLTLMLRLAGNISAGHIAILSFVGLIFIFGQSGASLGGSVLGTVVSIPLTMFMMAIELIVAFVQAFVFTILTASYIGAAIEDHHHVEEGHH